MAKSPQFVYEEWVPLQKHSPKDNVTGDIHIRFKVDFIEVCYVRFNTNPNENSSFIL
jgi:hypothetical protein